MSQRAWPTCRCEMWDSFAVVFFWAGPLHRISGLKNHNKRNSFSHSVILAYENNQTFHPVCLFHGVPEYLSHLHENSENIPALLMQKHPRHESEHLRANRDERVAEIMHRTFRIEKITGKRTQSGEANQTGTGGPTWPKPTRRWISTSVKQPERRGKSQETCLWKSKA